MISIILKTILLIEVISLTFSITLKSDPIVIVGGGPTGLATALMLEARGYSDISVIEKRESLSYDVEKSYHFTIDGRGQKLTNLLNLTSTLAKESIASTYLDFEEIDVNGKLSKQTFKANSKAITKYLLPRGKLIDIFHSRIKRSKFIKVLVNSNVNSIVEDETTGQITINTVNPANKSQILKPKLIIGCDGIHSTVRKWLEIKNPKKFHLTSKKSDSFGLSYKILKLKQSVPIGTSVIANSSLVYSIK